MKRNFFLPLVETFLFADLIKIVEKVFSTFLVDNHHQTRYTAVPVEPLSHVRYFQFLKIFRTFCLWKTEFFLRLESSLDRSIDQLARRQVEVIFKLIYACNYNISTL